MKGKYFWVITIAALFLALFSGCPNIDLDLDDDPDNSEWADYFFDWEGKDLGFGDLNKCKMTITENSFTWDSLAGFYTLSPISFESAVNKEPGTKDTYPTGCKISGKCTTSSNRSGGVFGQGTEEEVKPGDMVFKGPFFMKTDKNELCEDGISVKILEKK